MSLQTEGYQCAPAARQVKVRLRGAKKGFLRNLKSRSFPELSLKEAFCLRMQRRAFCLLHKTRTAARLAVSHRLFCIMMLSTALQKQIWCICQDECAPCITCIMRHARQDRTAH